MVASWTRVVWLALALCSRAGAAGGSAAHSRHPYFSKVKVYAELPAGRAADLRRLESMLPIVERVYRQHPGLPRWFTARRVERLEDLGIRRHLTFTYGPAFTDEADRAVARVLRALEGKGLPETLPVVVLDSMLVDSEVTLHAGFAIDNAHIREAEGRLGQRLPRRPFVLIGGHTDEGRFIDDARAGAETIAHEMGHLVGLGHRSARGNLMQPAPTAFPRLRTLDADQIQRIKGWIRFHRSRLSR